MVRSAASKVMWVGRATVFLVGLAVILAVVLGAATTALGATGGNFILGQPNSANAPTTLTWTGNTDVTKSALVLKNIRGGFPLHLVAGDGIAPMKVNSATKVANLNADKLDGKEASAFATQAQMSVFNAAEVIDTNGPLPRQGAYTSKGGTLLILASGSGYRDTATQGLIGMTVRVDGLLWGSPRVFTNETNSHKAFIDDYFVVTGLPAGQHTIRLEAIHSSSCTGAQSSSYTCTTTNEDDHFRVSVLEIPT